MKDLSAPNTDKTFLIAAIALAFASLKDSYALEPLSPEHI
jgi:hypothetical protein